MSQVCLFVVSTSGGIAGHPAHRASSEVHDEPKSKNVRVFDTAPRTRKPRAEPSLALNANNAIFVTSPSNQREWRWRRHWRRWCPLAK